MDANLSDKDETMRLPRWQFRKQCKLKRRREKRQAAAKEREKNAPPPTDEDIKRNVEKEHADRLEYQQQKELWEEREKRYTMVNIARKKAQEIEQEARANAQRKWQEALRRIPMLPAEFEALKDDKPKKAIQRMPTFISSGDNTAPLETRPRRRYKDLFREQKKKKQQEQEVAKNTTT